LMRGVLVSLEQRRGKEQVKRGNGGSNPKKTLKGSGNLGDGKKGLLP